MVLSILVIAVAGYFLGNVNGAILVSRFIVHDDVRTHGSGNAGFTNYYRNYGGMKSLLVASIDFLKAAAACLLGRWLLGRYGYALEGSMIGALSVTLGHDFPALYGFKGGKGILCGFAIGVTVDWRVAVICFILFWVSYLPTKLVSLGSVISALGFAIGFALFHHDNLFVLIGGIILSALAVYMHRANIVRLIHGEEAKTDFFRKGGKK